MVMVVIPFAVGIFFANAVELPWWLLALACVVSIVGAILLDKWRRMVALMLSIFAVGALLHSLSCRDDIAYNRAVDMVLKVESGSVDREGYTSAEACIVECEEPSLERCKVVLWGDSLVHFGSGDMLRLKSRVRQFRAEREQYARLMYHRGFVGSVSVNHRATYDYIPSEQESLHDRAVRRLQSAMEPGDGRAVVLTMTTGERCEISQSLRQSYSASGASHLLAVSGLHIGIAFMLINILLLPLVLLRHGNVVRSVVAITLIWLYVWLCGMSPSAVRAAIMFSLLQFSLSSLREYVSVNILAGTAFAMLALDSHLLFDISFQLSFIAVAGIILWAMPIYRLCATRFKTINLLLGVLLVGIASTLATMPLVSNCFATVSVMGILINPVVVLLANIIVLAGVVTLAIPPVGFVAEGVAEWQNSIIEWAASLPYSHFDFVMSEGAMWGIYAVYAIVTILIFSIPRKKKEVKIE
jgi:competence protein ComEC